MCGARVGSEFMVFAFVRVRWGSIVAVFAGSGELRHPRREKRNGEQRGIEGITGQSGHLKESRRKKSRSEHLCQHIIYICIIFIYRFFTCIMLNVNKVKMVENQLYNINSNSWLCSHYSPVLALLLLS